MLQVTFCKEIENNEMKCFPPICLNSRTERSVNDLNINSSLRITYQIIILSRMQKGLGEGSRWITESVMMTMIVYIHIYIHIHIHIHIHIYIYMVFATEGFFEVVEVTIYCLA